MERTSILHRKLAAEGAPNIKTVLQRQIKAMDRHAEGRRAGV
jgi:hypothetical protein